MAHTLLSKEEVVAKGRSIYEESLRSLLEPEHLDEFLALDTETGEWAVSSESLAQAWEKLGPRPVDGSVYSVRVGREYLAKLRGTRL